MEEANFLKKKYILLRHWKNIAGCWLFFDAICSWLLFLCVPLLAASCRWLLVVICCNLLLAAGGLPLAFAGCSVMLFVVGCWLLCILLLAAGCCAEKKPLRVRDSSTVKKGVGRERGEEASISVLSPSFLYEKSPLGPNWLGRAPPLHDPPPQKIAYLPSLLLSPPNQTIYKGEGWVYTVPITNLLNLMNKKIQ